MSFEDIFGGAPAKILLDAAVQAMLRDFDTFQSRARAWVETPAFLQAYHDAHPGPILKLIVNILNSKNTMVMRNAKLKEQYFRLGREGELRFAAGVIGNPQISKYYRLHFPAGVLATDRQDAESLLGAVRLAKKLAHIYIHPTGEMPQCEAMIADDTYRAMRRRPLPTAETEGLAASLFDIRVSSLELTQFGGPYPFVPLLVLPESGPFVVVPWPIIYGQPMPTGAPAASATGVSPTK